MFTVVFARIFFASRVFVLTTAVVVLATACGRSSDSTLDAATAEKLSSQIEPALFRVEATSCNPGELKTATAVALESNKVLTVAHTFDNVNSFELTNSQGKQLSATVERVDLEKDLALLQLAQILDSPIPEFGSVTTESTVLVVGSDFESENFQTGTILETSNVFFEGQQTREAVLISSDITPGDSGSVVLNTSGELAAMVFASDIATSQGWAISATEIQDFLAEPDTDGTTMFQC